MQGPHSHWEEYHVRTIKVPSITADNYEQEVLQCICIGDGIIFHEVEIENKDD